MSVEPARYNFKIWKGTTFQYRMTYLVGDATSDPVDLTGYSATMPVTNAAGDTLFTLGTGGNGITLGDATGTIDLLIPDSLTSTFTWTNANYKLIISAPGVVDILLFGNMVVTGI